jgi:predicted nucleic acid-binding protein
MSDVFADTYYFVALVNRKGDEARARAMDATRMRNGRLVTTGWVLTELANTLSEPRHRQLFLNILATLQGDTQTSIIQPDVQLFEQGIALFAARPDKEWSLTDCISFIVMQREGITEALTGDRHFEQAGFLALLK